MVSSTPKQASKASPSTWLLLCQNACAAPTAQQQEARMPAEREMPSWCP